MLADINDMRDWLESTEHIAALLSVAWEAFDLIRTVCRQHETACGTDFAAYAMAAAAAVRGRNIIAAAPSIPPRRINLAQAGLAKKADTGQVADALAVLAAALSGRLTSTVMTTASRADEQAGEQAATQAESIRALLTSR
ncbi:MAG TPA: hypothetical protein VKV02_13815 [Acidobacteriaceae bacterium]|nr:hypothetical protein [Acidobacteriaceae bacterium]